MTDTRAVAAQCLADVALRGASLRERLKPAQAQLSDARDRALLTALANEGARWWLRFDKALDGLLQQPLRKREPTVHALLVLGLVQLETMQMPAHAAVAATVEATRALDLGGFAKLANAVLRRWLRERGARLTRLDADAVTRVAHPDWLIDALQRDWPEHSGSILEANNTHAPPMLRVNTRRATRDSVIRSLEQANVEAHPYADLRDAVTLAANTGVTHLHGFTEGYFSVQDGAAQVATDLMDLHEGARVLDACAAPGGKACHMLERGNVDLLAIERDVARTASIGHNLQRLGLQCEVRTGDAGEPDAWWDGKPFDRILLDAPCSATGVIRRHPDIKLHRRAGDIVKYTREQQRLLTALWPLLARGGRLVYATCSVLRAENEAVVATFLGNQADAQPQAFELPVGRRAGAGWQVLPGEGGLDGMYYVVLARK